MTQQLDIDALPHLAAALSHSRPDGQNLCVHRAAALMLDLRNATLVFGVMRAATPEEQAAIGPQAASAPFIHAWVEYGGELYTPTQTEYQIERFGQIRGVSIADYYSTYGITRTWRLDYPAFMQVARRLKLSASLRHGGKRAGSGDVPEALLRAAGVKYVLNERKTILPAPHNHSKRKHEHHRL